MIYCDISVGSKREIRTFDCQPESLLLSESTVELEAMMCFLDSSGESLCIMYVCTMISEDVAK